MVSPELATRRFNPFSQWPHYGRAVIAAWRIQAFLQW
jgi:hypothetical protein